MTADEKAGQLERSFGIPHPRRLLAGALRRASKYDGAPVTEFSRSVVDDRMREMAETGLTAEEAALVLLLRGCPVASLVAWADDRGHYPDGRSFHVLYVSEAAAEFRIAWRRLTADEQDDLIARAQSNIRLWNHV